MLHHYLRGEPARSSAHWAVGVSTRFPGLSDAVILQISNAKGEQARERRAPDEAASFAENMRTVLALADRMTIELTENGEPIRVQIRREDGLDFADAIDRAIAKIKRKATDGSSE